MRQLLLLSGLLMHLFAFAQEDEAERIAERLRSVSMGNEYDSIILLHGQLKQLDRGAARESRNMLYVVQAYLGKGDTRNAKRYARKIYRKPAVSGISRKMTSKLIAKHYCSESFYRYYGSKNDLRKSVKYLVKAVDHQPSVGCGTGRRRYKERSYKTIIDHYTQLGKPRKAEKYRKKLESL